MKSSKNLLLIVLSVAVVALAAMAWNQYRQLLDLRAQVAEFDGAAMKRKLADANKTIKSLQDRLAAMRGSRRGGPEQAGPDEGPGGPNGPEGRRGRFGAFATLAANPEFQKLLAIQMKGRITQTYASLFKSLNLTPDQLNQFQSLLADKQQAMMDTLQAAREQGINPREDPTGFQALMAQATAQTDQQIQQALGDAGFAQYQQYQQTLPERNTVNSLQQALSYSQTPLTDDQANSMISLLAADQPERAGSGTANTNGGQSLMQMMNGGGTAKVTDDAITQASSVLSASQVTALQQIQAQQQAQYQMQQMMRQSSQGSGAGTSTVSTGAPKG